MQSIAYKRATIFFFAAERETTPSEVYLALPKFNSTRTKLTFVERILQLALTKLKLSSKQTEMAENGYEIGSYGN